MNQRQPELFDLAPAPWELDDADQRSVAVIVLPEPPYGPFDYVVPDSLLAKLRPGHRVRVPLGKGNRPVLGYCVEVKPTAGPGGPRRLKELTAVLDQSPLLTAAMLRLTKWMADHYLCPWGQVLEAVVPADVRRQAGTREVAFLSVSNVVIAKLPQLKLPPKQAEVLKVLASSPVPLTAAELTAAASCTAAPIRELVRKGLVRAEAARVERFEPAAARTERDQALALNDDQQRAVEAIRRALQAGQHETLLLFGVTGSGKTEVYLQAIEEVVGFGRQAIVLVPEISLTPQTVARFHARFPQVAVLHSHLSGVERNAHWQRIRRGEIQVVVGARSAIFAPTPNLGLIVLDEEHDGSFKQDLAPRYHARDVALQRAEMDRVPVVLGSATPSLESWRAAQLGRYRLLELPRRVLSRPLPDVGIVDLRLEFQNRTSRGAISRQLHQAMRQALDEQGQVLLLLNRRGYSTSIQCPACGAVVKCPACDLALTHHREGAFAACHYCEYQIEAPANCPDCRFEGIRYSGLGTQKLEAEVRARFPQARVLRMDSDSMQKPGSHEQAFAKVRAGEIDVLLGTQMIAKGLDFPNVTLVGVVNADTALHFPDFRAAERTFQLVTQVAGRTGRGERGGRVLVQTFSPEHPSILCGVHHDFPRFAALELPVRDEYGYPPAASMVRVIVRSESEAAAESFIDQLAQRARSAAERTAAPLRVMGPAPAPLAKLRGLFRFHLLLIHPDSDTLRALALAATENCQAPDDVQWVMDVDPFDML